MTNAKLLEKFEDEVNNVTYLENVYEADPNRESSPGKTKLESLRNQILRRMSSGPHK